MFWFILSMVILCYIIIVVIVKVSEAITEHKKQQAKLQAQREREEEKRKREQAIRERQAQAAAQKRAAERLRQQKEQARLQQQKERERLRQQKEQARLEYEKNLPEHKRFIAEQRRLMTDSMRYDILRRDGFRCQICGASAKDGMQLHVDHIMPVSKGGKTEPSNLRTLCERCNLGKSNKIETPILNEKPAAHEKPIEKFEPSFTATSRNSVNEPIADAPTTAFVQPSTMDEESSPAASSNPCIVPVSSVDELIAVCKQQNIRIVDKRPSKGNLWIESTAFSDALIQQSSALFPPPRQARSKAMGKQLAWYIPYSNDPSAA